jgi:ferredoxin
MRLSVDLDRCQGHTMCLMNAPGLFDVSDDDGHAIPKVTQVPAELESTARMAADGCPEIAIILTEG